MTRPGRTARELGILCAALAVMALAAFGAQRLLFPRRAPAPDIPAALDDALGPLLGEEVRTTRKVLDEPAVSGAFSAIIGRLLPAMPRPIPTLDLLVIDSPDINAFTLPGRVICIDTGLVRALDSADEMAAVIGHELSHAANRDPLALLARQLGMATVAGVLTGGQGGALLSSMVQSIVNVRYGREAEDRADAFSVSLLARAGIDPASFGKALERIRDAGTRGPGLLMYLDPHSPIDRRIARAQEQARQEPYVSRELPVDWEKLVEALPPQ